MPSSSAKPSLTVASLTWAFPAGPNLFNDLSFTVPPGLHALVGANGAGKSTLFTLIAGLLHPTGGTITAGEVGYLPQFPATDAATTIADAVGITDVRDALARIEAGTGTTADFDTVGDDWDVLDTTRAALARAGVPDDVDRPLRTLSGGERTAIAVLAQLRARPQVLLLDEPTSNLDQSARAWLFDALTSYASGGRCVFAISHDLEFLELMDSIYELHHGHIRHFGGPYSHYRDAIAAEQHAALQAHATARNELKTQKAQRQAAQIAAARNAKAGQRDQRNKKFPPLVAGLRKQSAETTAGKQHRLHDAAVDQAAAQVAATDSAIRKDELLRLELPDPHLPAGRVVLDYVDTARLQLVGPERVRIAGPNGSGKSTLLRALRDSGAICVPYAAVEQDIAFPNSHATVIEHIRDARPGADPSAAHAHAARLLFIGDDAQKPIAALSGGERLRLALAHATFRSPMPSLLILDEPTNHLDIDGVEALSTALHHWRGALLFVTHDEELSQRLHPGRTLGPNLQP